MTLLITFLASKLKIPIWAVEVGLAIAASLGIFLFIQNYAARKKEEGAAEAKPGIIKQFEDERKDEWKKIEEKNQKDAESNAMEKKSLSSDRTALNRDLETARKARAAADGILEQARQVAQARKEAGYADASTLHGAELLLSIRSKSAELAAAAH